MSDPTDPTHPTHPTGTVAMLVRDLDVVRGRTPVLHGVDLTLGRGRIHVVLGASGSGKSTLLRALAGLVPQPSTVTAGTLALTHGATTVDLSDGGPAWRHVRGHHVGFMGQDPALDLTPLRRAGSVVREAGGVGRDRVPAVLADCGLPDPAVAGRYCCELSGGMAQRLALGLATVRAPEVVLADEPSTALDALARAELARRLRTLADEGAAVLLVTHDVVLARGLADDLTVLDAGRVVEHGPAAAVLSDPTHPTTRDLVGVRRPRVVARPAGGPRASGPVLEVTGLGAGWRRGTEVLHDVSLHVGAAETVGVVGRSGAGKSTLVSCLTGLLEPTRGEVALGGRRADRRSWRALRRQVQLVPQDPRGSLNPWRTVAQQVRGPLEIHRVGTRAARDDRVADLLDRVGLTGLADRRPGSLSTGQCQRVAIARALAVRPALVLADEPVTALDTVLRAEMVELFAEVVRADGTAALVISHDLHLLEHLCDRLLVLDGGTVVEELSAQRLRHDARHALTRALVDAHPPLPAPGREATGG